MKRFALIISLSALFLIGVSSCGPSQEELEKQKKTEDSLNQLDSDNSVDEANKLLQQADSIEQAKRDSLAAAENDMAKK